MKVLILAVFVVFIAAAFTTESKLPVYFIGYAKLVVNKKQVTDEWNICRFIIAENYTEANKLFSEEMDYIKNKRGGVYDKESIMVFKVQDGNILKQKEQP